MTPTYPCQAIVRDGNALRMVTFRSPEEVDAISRTPVDIVEWLPAYGSSQVLWLVSWRDISRGRPDERQTSVFPVAQAAVEYMGTLSSQPAKYSEIRLWKEVE